MGIERDWHNIDLASETEKDLNIMEPYSFRALLLEIDCNLEEITEEKVAEQFSDRISELVSEACEIFLANRANIVAHAKAEKEEK
jgi:formiminotetrahydrofolate cyclodeaminase